jgi:uncharacterized repeat protein (TIGR03803 family)
LHAFDSTLGGEGIDPAGVTVDEHGNIFGVTSGDVNSGQFGVAFELTTSGKSYSERVLYSFSCATDGYVPESAPALDAKTGNLYVSNNEGGPGFGTIIELSPAGSAYVRTGLYAFVSGAGDQPLGVPLLLDGRVYVTACCNGGDSGGGTISALVPNGLAGIQLYYFASGGVLFDGLIPDSSGKLYGTTLSDGPSGLGSVFSFAPSKTGGRESVLYVFEGGLDGQYPTAPVVIDAGGNIYGTTEEGGTKSLEPSSNSRRRHTDIQKPFSTDSPGHPMARHRSGVSPSLAPRCGARRSTEARIRTATFVVCALTPHRAAQAGSSPAIAHLCAPTARVA